MNTITNEILLKKLQPILEDVETEYVMVKNPEGDGYKTHGSHMYRLGYFPDVKAYKTLTFEEVLDLLPSHIRNIGNTYVLDMTKLEDTLYIYSYRHIYDFQKLLCDGRGERPIIAIQNLLDYLITNNLLGSQNATAKM